MQKILLTTMSFAFLEDITNVAEQKNSEKEFP